MPPEPSSKILPLLWQRPGYGPGGLNTLKFNPVKFHVELYKLHVLLLIDEGITAETVSFTWNFTALNFTVFKMLLIKPTWKPCYKPRQEGKVSSRLGFATGWRILFSQYLRSKWSKFPKKKRFFNELYNKLRPNSNDNNAGFPMTRNFFYVRLRA